MLATQTLSCTEDYPLCPHVKSSKGHLEFLAGLLFLHSFPGPGVGVGAGRAEPPFSGACAESELIGRWPEP